MINTHLKSVFFFIPFLMGMVLWSGTAYAIEGVYHDPYGSDGLYEVKETERFPRDPVAGENVYIKITTWPIEPGQATWVTWKKNGVDQNTINGSYVKNEDNNTYWEVNLGSFSKGDSIEYTVHANKNDANEKTIGPFSFTVTDWENIESVDSFTDLGGRIELNASANTGSFSPKINISFADLDVFRVQMSPKGSASFSSGLSNYDITDNASEIVISTSELQVKIQKNPYQMNVYEKDGSTLIAREYNPTQNQTLGWLTDGNTVIDKVENHFYTPSDEEFYGFGERYNQFGKRGTDVDTYVYNQYRNQGERTYLAIPFFLNTNGYGVLLNTTYYSKFKLATENSDMYSFTADSGGEQDTMLDYYFIYGKNLTDVVSNYSNVTSKPEMLPKWAFGLWMSANEWDRQSEVSNAVTQAKQHDIPTTAMVLEQWSDEHTFYAFNDAQYTPKSGGEALTYNDYTFGGKWPDPKGMVDEAHNNNIKVLMWQIPVLKYTEYPYQQKDNDEAYMINQSYAVKNSDGSPYRIPENKWFGNSLLVDFTNQNATDWWMSKRSYLFDDIGIDGFKTDGGEMVWGRDTTFSNGKTGDEMRNQYPNEYIKAYHDFAKTKKSDALTFSRAGTTGVQEYGIYWAGDQTSTFGAFQEAIRAGLSANASGVPFWSWDLAGFTGSFPTAELYKRAAEMSAFSPIMQFHSEKADPSISEERSPWNVASRTGDSTVIDTFRKYTNTRMNLLPYIYSEAKKSSEQGIPMMKSLVLEYPKDPNTHDVSTQYLFGDSLLVSPIVEEGATTRDVYLPEGEWIDFYYGAQRPGKQTIDYYAGIDDIPVFVKSGGILPMNLNNEYELGGSIGNDLDSYENLTFRIYPNKSTSYDWFDDIGGSVKQVTSHEEYNQEKVTVNLPVTNTATSLQVFTSQPGSVTNNGDTLSKQSSVENLISSNSGWYYDSQQKLVYVKLSSNTEAQTIVFHGVDSPGYEAEFAKLTGVSTNTDHSDYTGTGFVDQFETNGDSVAFNIQANGSGQHTVGIRYAAGTENAQRAIFVNGEKVQDITLLKTTNWDTWNTASLTLPLVDGRNTFEIRYDSSSNSGINLDSVSVD